MLPVSWKGLIKENTTVDLSSTGESGNSHTQSVWQLSKNTMLGNV